MKQYTLLLALAGLTLATSACSKDKDNEPRVSPTNEEVKTITIDASAYDKYVYFSFEKGAVVETVAWDDATIRSRQDWDLGLHRYEFRTNSGESGAGQGGAFETANTDIKTPVTIPAADAFQADTHKQLQLVEFGQAAGGHSFNYQEASLNPVLSAQITYGANPAINQTVTKPGAITQYMRGHGDGGGSGPSVVLSDKVYLVRTASGKVAKVKVTAYRKAVTDPTQGGRPVTGHITLEYVYPVQ